jgi:hypothetical protein
MWHEVVDKICKLKYLNIHKEYMTSLDIANRIMRRENFLIGLINKDILQIHLPFFSGKIGTARRMTFSLEWAINQSIFGYLFNEDSRKGYTLNRSILDPSQASAAASQ